jgi:hypothetical protein
MANTLTSVIATLQTAANQVGREQVGFAMAAYKNADATKAAYNQTVSYPIVPTMSAAAVTPAATSPAGTDLTITNGTITMDNLRKVSWNFTGEDEVRLMRGDSSQVEDVRTQIFAQAMRTLVNEIENSCFLAAYKGSSRAYGTAGTAPFATAADFSDFAGVAQILDDNGAPVVDRHLVVGGAAMANLRGKQSVLFKANEAGTDETLRKGSIGEVMGFNVHQSYPITQVTKGTGASATTDNAGYAVGSTTLTLASAGTGTLLSGDVVTFAGDTNKYVINSGDADVSNGGTISLGRPGLRVAMSAATKAITVGNSYTPNIALQRMGLHLVMRAPATGGDAAVDTVTVTDQYSGLVFQLARYAQYMQSSWELRVLYGVKVTNPDFIATLIG